MTHHNAAFIAIATEGDDLVAGLAENGETSVLSFGSVEGGALDAIARLIHAQVLTSLDLDRPLVVVVGKNKNRATAGEAFLEGFARAVVRRALRPLPVFLVAVVAGSYTRVLGRYYTPQVTAAPLKWATRSTATISRVRSFLDSLATTDDGLALIPRGYTYAQ